MAIAGKVAITPKGDWNNILTYNKLDLVKYNNSLYIAKKSNQNIIPEDGDIWMLAVKSYDEEEFNKLITDVDDINRNLDYLKNIFDGRTEAGYLIWDTGEKTANSSWTLLSTKYRCEEGDVITLNLPDTVEYISFIFFDSSNNVLLGGRKWSGQNVSSFSYTAPSEASYCYIAYMSITLDISKIVVTGRSYVAKDVAEQNASLEDYKIDNKFDGAFTQGGYDSSGKFVSSSTTLCNTNKIRINEGDLASIYFTQESYTRFLFFDSSNNFISSVVSSGKVSELKAIAPTNASYFIFNVGRDYEITPTYAIDVRVYVNSEIDVLKNDLDKLNSLPKGSIIQIEADKDDTETTTQKYGWQYLGTSNIQYENGSLNILVTNVYRKNN